MLGAQHATPMEVGKLHPHNSWGSANVAGGGVYLSFGCPSITGLLMSEYHVNRSLYLLSHPLLKIATWRFWFCLSRDVYDGNRSFAYYTKTKTVESDV
jgi:hypothetical protein